MKYKILNVLPEFGTNTYLLWDEESEEAMMIDPANRSNELLDAVKSLKLKYIVLTHGHGDHIGGVGFMKDETNAKVAIHEQDAPMLNDPQKNLSVHWGENLSFPEADIKLNDGDIFKLGNKEITVIHTPGHSLGGICLFVDDLLFCGDTFFAGSIGRTDLPGGNYQTLINSIQKKLFDLGDQVTAFPGHGPETTIGQEKVSNPFAGLNA